jgi:hypothetical protein
MARLGRFCQPGLEFLLLAAQPPDQVKRRVNPLFEQPELRFK